MKNLETLFKIIHLNGARKNIDFKILEKSNKISIRKKRQNDNQDLQ